MATNKQKNAVENLVGNGGNVTKAMRDAEYSENTLNTPQKLTESKGYEELMEEYLPDNMLLRALHEDIDVKKQNRKAELELAFKIKGRMVERTDLTSGGKPIILPSELINKNDTPQDTEESSN